MILQRMTIELKPGNRRAYAEWLRESARLVSLAPDRWRVCFPISGDWDRAVVDFIFDDWAAHIQFWANYNAVAPQSHEEKGRAMAHGHGSEFFTIMA